MNAHDGVITLGLVTLGLFFPAISIILGLAWIASRLKKEEKEE